MWEHVGTRVNMSTSSSNHENSYRRSQAITTRTTKTVKTVTKTAKSVT